FLVGPNLFGLVAGKLAGVKTIVWGNSVSSFTPRDFGLKGIGAALLSKYTSRLVDVIISNSVVGQLEHEKRFISGKRNSVIWNGIDTKKFCPDIDERNRFRENLGIGPTTKLIGQVSRIVEWKGHQIALDAAAELCTAYPEVRFVFVGDGEDNYLSILKEKTRQLDLEDKVYWLGERSDINTIMNGLDVFFLSSLRGEGFANVIAEAMSTETVPVVSDVGDSKAVVGDTGIVVEPGDVSELVNAWLRLISDQQLLVKMGSEARARVRVNYSLETMIESTCSVINNHDEHQI
ncbi:MAG TPA: glycosyltransferase, partial [Dehalococcoidia bacterium]|nr:glycosyltransferase [Dehalococcoidia bacterium]